MKSSKFRFFRLVALVIVMAQLLSLSTVVAFASSNDETIQQNETILPVESTITENLISTENVVLEPERELKPVISSDKFTTSEKIQLGFDKTDVIDYYYVANGVTVTEGTDNSMEFEIDAVDEFGSVDVYADYGNGELVKSSIYTYKQGNVVYISDISKDRAWYNCMEEQYNQGLLTKEEWNDRYSELSQTFIKEDLSNNNASVSLMATSTTTTVKGRLQWELADGTLLPLRQTKVELRDKEPIDSRSIATTYTDNNGNFTFTFENPDEWYNFENGGLDVFIRWYTETKTFEVKQDLVFTYNYFETPVKENVTTGSTTTFNYYVTYDTSNNVNKSIYVLQGMVVGQRFATAMGMSTDNFIHVIYPSGDGSIFPSDSAFCWGEILDNCYSIIGTNKFNDFDTLIHEYGHFVECSMGNYGASLWEIIVNNPNHSANTDHFTDKPEKEYAMELTWSEAWATAFAQIAQSYYSTEYNGVPGFADITDGTNYEAFTYNANSGEAQEHAVIAFLWDLYDSGTNESYDNIALGYKSWWNYTTKKGTYTLQDFANVVENYYPSKRSLVGELMGAHQISPRYLTITNYSSVSETTAPQLSWRVNGSTSSPNDLFQVVFYDNYGNYIYSTSNISNSQAYNTTFNYNVPLSVWKQVIKNYGGTFTINIAVRAYRTGEFTSGPYISKYAPISLTVNKNLNITASNRYTESQVKLDKGGYCDYTVTFATSGYKLIQTFGTRDTKIELYSASGTLLTNNDDGGYSLNSLIKYYCSANTEYTIRVKFWSSSTYGETKLAITPAYGALNSDSSDLTTYEDIYAITTYTGYTWGTYAQKNYVRVITYTPPSSGSYTFTIESEFDTYIYVIDPRSSELVKINVNYNDDSGEGMNPLLTTTLEANVPYLIIYSAYNPNSLTETQNLTVKINKN